MLLRTLAILLNHGDFAGFLFDHLSPAFYHLYTIRRPIREIRTFVGRFYIFEIKSLNPVKTRLGRGRVETSATPKAKFR